ncbi:MAG: hypothetical protein K8T89_01885 [Planctomycetes bacterium]|nr:hypothetical protein [Planctomycetota bacterium]
MNKKFIMLLAAFALTGCVEIETRIKLNTDGSATITERVRFSQQLLDLGSKEKGELNVAELLTKQSVEGRMKRMGKNVKLVKHTVTDAEKGSKESIAIFKVSDINDFQYVSPFVAYTDFPENNAIKIEMVPLLKSRNYAGMAGEMCIAFRPVKPPKGEVRLKDAPPDKGPIPRDVQVLRQLQPVFADLLKGFKLRLTFESFSPIMSTGFGWRDRRTATPIVDLIHLTEHDLDQHGVSILENEEIVLDLLRGRLGSPNIAEAVKQFQDNNTVPLVLIGARSTPPGGRAMRSRSSRPRNFSTAISPGKRSIRIAGNRPERI